MWDSLHSAYQALHRPNTWAAFGHTNVVLTNIAKKLLKTDGLAPKRTAGDKGGDTK